MDAGYVIAGVAVAVTIAGGALALSSKVDINTIAVEVQRDVLFKFMAEIADMKAALAVVEDRQRRRCPPD